MKAPVLARWVAPLLIACSGSVDAADAPTAGSERVFVEAALARLDESELALVRSQDMDQVIMSNSPHLISTVGGLADTGVPLLFDPGAQAKARGADSADGDIALNQLEVTPSLTGSREVRLDMKLNVSAAGSEHSFTKADHFSASRLLVWDTELKTRSGESVVLLVQPTVIQSKKDLEKILLRRAASAPPASAPPAKP